MTTRGDAAMDALYDQWDAAHRDHPDDCRCYEGCAFIAAIDEWEHQKRVKLSIVGQMTRPLRDRLVPMNRQYVK